MSTSPVMRQIVHEYICEPIRAALQDPAGDPHARASYKQALRNLRVHYDKPELAVPINVQINAAVELLRVNGYKVTAPYTGVCALSECSKAFVVAAGQNGAPRRKFCCREHMLMAHDRGATARVTAARKRNKRREEKK